MARISRYVLGLLLSALVTGCAPESAQSLATAVASTVVEAQSAVAETTTSPILELQSVVQEELPAPAAEPLTPMAPIATKLIVRWEVTSPAAYTKKYQGVVCPGGASGPTVGIGYDLGHQTRATIEREWVGHPALSALVAGSGVVGPEACTAYRRAHPEIQITYADAVRVFEHSTLPAYTSAARRALPKGWDVLAPGAQAANVSLGYNRGWTMAGDRNREKRAIRDDCVPIGDRQCNASQLRGMCRLWAGTPNGAGLCARRNDEAKVALQ
jgi:GH24 family phage-related lysozyme (muramidase)